MQYLKSTQQQPLKSNTGSNTTQDTSTFSTSTLNPGLVTTNNTTDISISNYTQPILYARSRNIEFDSNSLKPSTRFYPFFTQIDISNHVTPKLLEIEMISGSFQPGETVESSSTFIENKIIFRLCKLNHKTGSYNFPETIFPINPYNQQPLGQTYSESSTILNIDTKSLGLPSETDFYGSVSIGMTLIGKSSGAVARVSNIRLISDRNGRLIGSFYIPNPNIFGNIKFINGVNIFTLIDVNSLSLVLKSESFSETNYTSSAVNNVTETNILTTRNVNITLPYLVTTTGQKTTITTYNPNQPTPPPPQALSGGGASGGGSNGFGGSGGGTVYLTGNLIKFQYGGDANAALAAAKASGATNIIAGQGAVDTYGLNPKQVTKVVPPATVPQANIYVNPFKK